MAINRPSPSSSVASLVPPPHLPPAKKNDIESAVVLPPGKIPLMISKLNPSTIKNNNGAKRNLWDLLPLDVILATFIWIFVGIAAICTSKMLVMHEFSVPPLVLAFQQLTYGTTLFRIYLTFVGGIQPIPEPYSPKPSKNKIWHLELPNDFVMIGLFHALDILATNTSFSHSSASFVETIKASEPITTTAIALFFAIDRLKPSEAVALAVLVGGVVCSTLGNASSPTTTSDTQSSLFQSIKSCLIVMSANLCFGLRAKSQKLFRAKSQGKPMDDANLMMNLMSTAAKSLLIPLLLFEFPGVVVRTLNTPLSGQLHYLAISIFNGTTHCVYGLAGTYVLTKVSVVQHASLGCMRRLLAIIITSIFFRVPISLMSALGIITSFLGFSSFTYLRHRNNS